MLHLMRALCWIITKNNYNYENLWEWNKTHSSSASDFLTLWNFFFPYNNTHHNNKKIINVMISMFDLKNSKNMTQIFMYYYCYKLLESSMCPFQPRLHLCITHSMCHLTHIIRQDDDDGMFFCYASNITTPCVLEVNVKGRILLDKNNLSHIDVTFDSFRWGGIFIHALGKTN